MFSHVRWICLLIVSGAFFAIVPQSQAADHLDSPSVETDGRLDINDVYVFQSPTTPTNSVFIMTVNPAAGMLSPTTFNPRGVYEFNVDFNGDAVSDYVYQFTFTRDRRGVQTVILRRNGVLLARGSTGQNIAVTGGGLLRCDLFEDPFYFDLNGFENNLQFTGTDFFAGFNTNAIVLEIPSQSFLQNPSSTNIGLSSRTTIDGQQFDRMGRPAINTALIDGDARKNLFNQGSPATDQTNFLEEVQMKIAALGGDPALGTFLLPDQNTFDTSNASGFPNGRQPANDVIDTELTLISGGAVTTDGVDSNDAPYPNTFPYLAPPNQ